MPQLLNNVAVTGSAVQWDGGVGVFSVDGTFSGATVSLQAKRPDTSNWFDVGANTTLTAAGAGGFVLGSCQIRASVSGGTPAALYASADKV